MNSHQFTVNEIMSSLFSYEESLTYLTLDILKSDWISCFAIELTDEKELFISVLRRTLKKYRADCDALLDDTEGKHTIGLRKLLKQSLEHFNHTVSQHYSNHTLQQVSQFLDNYVITTSYKQYRSSWLRLLFKLNQSESHIMLERLGIRHIALKCLKDIAEQYNAFWELNDSSFNTLRQNIRSEWDKEEFNYYQGDLDEESGNLLLGLSQYITAKKAEEVVQHLMTELNEQDIQIFNQWLHLITNNSVLSFPLTSLKEKTVPLIVMEII